MSLQETGIKIASMLHAVAFSRGGSAHAGMYGVKLNSLTGAARPQRDLLTRRRLPAATDRF